MKKSVRPSSTHPITAREMSEALEFVAHKLKTKKILDQANLSVLIDEAKQLRSKGRATSWSILIDRARPLMFAKFSDKKCNEYIPQIVCAGIHVDHSPRTTFHFQQFDNALEILNSEKQIVARWHVDMANANSGGMQDGPMFHLQYGGLCSNGQGELHPLKEPRWCHPPVDVLLLCEIVAANFFPAQWEELRDEANWCAAIATGEKLCYPFFIAKMQEWLDKSSKTCLHSMWASEWN